MNHTSTPFTIVSDPGIDDLVALCLLKALTPGVSHTLAATFGNGPVSVTGKNAQEFITAVAPDWHYRDGAGVPANGVLERPYPDYFHGPDAAWGVHTGCTIREMPQTAWTGGAVISLGPMAEVAAMAAVHPMTHLTVMGGAFAIPGNETEYAETNIAFDPDAAHGVFAGIDGFPVSVVPLDVTRTVMWDHAAVAAISPKTPGAKWIREMILAWETNYSHEREEAFNLHDPLAVYLTFFPEAAEWKETGVRVVTRGKRRGQTVFDDTAPVCHIATRIYDPERVAREIAGYTAMV